MCSRSEPVTADGDTLSDAAELELASLGFDWQVSQPELVQTLQGNAELAGLFSLSQVQALNVDFPLLTRDPVSGHFSVTIGLQKSSRLVEFTDFPVSGPQVSINPEGKIEVQFTVPDNAAFFRLQSK